MANEAIPAAADLKVVEQSSAGRRSELATDIAAAAFLRGSFVLSSGVQSNYYLDKYLFETKPSILRRVASFLAELVPPSTERIAGPELGAVALATALSLETGLPFVIVRKEGKGYGTDHAVEGELYPGERVVVIEDVVSTGTQALRAARNLQDLGVHVESVMAVIDREQGGPQAIEAAGFHFRALFSRQDLGI